MKFRLSIALAFSTLVAGVAFGQATRTWVSGVGDDANPCSRTAPCKTFAGAISKTIAGGQISVLDPGGFGGVTITKSITLDGTGTLAGILNASTNGVTINANATARVTLRNLQIDGAGTGLNGINIVVNGAGTVIVEDTAIMNTQKGISVTHTTGTVALFVKNVDITGCGLNGVSLAPTGTGIAYAMLNGVRISSIGTNATHDGIFQGVNTGTHLNDVQVFRASGAGLHVGGAGALATVQSSSFIRNGSDGVFLDGAGCAIRLDNATAAQNGGAGFRATAGTIFSYRNNRSSDNGLVDTGNTQQFFY